MTRDDPAAYDDDVEWIGRGEVQRLMGGVSTSTLYADPEIRALAIPLTPAGSRTKKVRWIKSEVIELRRQRIAAARAKAQAVREKVIAQNERSRERRRRPSGG